MKWNKFLATLAMLIVSATAFAEREQSFFMELFGASTSLGIHYDSRFSDYTRWGGRIGIAYTYSRSQDFFESAPERTRGWSFPIAVNYLIGNGRHHGEIGIGISYGLYSCMYHDKAGREVEYDTSGSFGFLDLGYRYQSERGIMVRVGLSPGVALKAYDESGLKNKGVNRAAVFYPYVGVGYNF